ncbi:hypothetical protein F1D05_35485 [Kribbella qitaiheensis]|uniref:Uncharacterized protein n=1 Tax=Kribbella qitaiheensis TaxID=1544730 RepID=A0A7G6X7M6_9ACTN|nr:hypothetical protein [Kribbella qitaiheensis]QNE22241.1 hypothetical protein F1D05_35485 [Kribbella qitaiheensis]
MPSSPHRHEATVEVAPLVGAPEVQALLGVGDLAGSQFVLRGEQDDAGGEVVQAHPTGTNSIDSTARP